MKLTSCVCVVFFWIIVFGGGCDRLESEPSPDPVASEAPFSGPVEPVPAPPSQPPLESLPVIPQIGASSLPMGKEQATSNRNAWLTSDFRCRAISTVRFRKCRFQPSDAGHSLKFQNDVYCENVEFGEDGHPLRLTGCRSKWLSIPGVANLKRGNNSDIWFGSQSGWRWKDGEKYCCTGIWLEAPKGLSTR